MMMMMMIKFLLMVGQFCKHLLQKRKHSLTHVNVVALYGRLICCDKYSLKKA